MIELHRHLEGSIRIETIFDVGRELGLMSDRIEDVRRMYEMTPLDPVSYTNFFCKIGHLKRYLARRDIIERVAREAVEDARREGVKRLELRFSPAFFRSNFNPQDVTEWIVRATTMPGIEVTYLATIGRSFPREMNQPTIDVALGTRYFVGLDLAGNELVSNGLEYEDVFRKARERGMGITVHAAEHPDAASNTRLAIERLHATRIGHGIFTPPADLEFAMKRGIVFELCPTSNHWLGGTCPAKEWLRRGLKITLNTDDPRVFRTTLPQEFEAAGLSDRRKELTAAARSALFG